VAHIADDPRVTSLEGINARDYSAPESIAFITADISFISLILALPTILDTVVPDAKLIALIKPQFEVGRERLPKDGIVKTLELHQSVCDISRFLVGEGWNVLGVIPSPIEGGDGNREFLVAAIKNRLQG
jgi:23S rRNA (cytidine1920-2'-O)/16S rRNA (cytidine1409-2'-O)-methyltransferase